MKKTAKSLLALTLALILCLAVGCTTGTGGQSGDADGPIKFTMTYSDNPTLPFKNDWLSVKTANELFNVDVTYEVIPTADYSTKTIAELQTGTKIDVMLYRTPKTGELASLALNGAIVPISDYVDKGWCPNFEKYIKDWGMQDELNAEKLSDGKYYYLPALYDKQFYDGGLILREDLLEEFKMDAPKTYDDLYEYLKKCKERDPECYPLTYLVGPRVFYRMTMPSFGISLGENASTGTWVLSWDYDKKEYFAGAISDDYKTYLEYLAKLYAEGLLDPEFYPQGDMWATKMSTGAATATYAYYDQIGGVIANSEVEGIKLNLYPPLEGSNGAHHQPKSRLGSGIIFTEAASKRSDFEQLVRAVDKMFYSEEAVNLWCLGVEGVTYDWNDDVFGGIEFMPEARDSGDGIYKYLQVEYGLGSDPLQQVWINAHEMTKYDENYAQINAAVAAMDNAIQAIPPSALFTEDQAEQANLYQAALKDAFDIWAEDFITGKKSLDTDWAAYVAEMQTKGIDKMLEIYNAAKR